MMVELNERELTILCDLLAAEAQAMEYHDHPADEELDTLHEKLAKARDAEEGRK